LSNFIAFVSGMLALTFVIKFLEKKSALSAFGYYRVILSLSILIILFMK
jgi:undecaprenyl pyrophosphate phosphatase UppP